MTFLNLCVSGGIWLGQLAVYLLLACSLGDPGRSYSSDRACARDQLVRLRARAMAGHPNGRARGTIYRGLLLCHQLTRGWILAPWRIRVLSLLGRSAA